ncbi:hypothetical protein [Breoghania sp.]|uniref:hypothetical protein n=1 Tax=Breoghania sp. TaxID=2065378 RepID=UPI0026375089|nr:hypothetical protein [Breoghania sp.]MDJ0932198.1 hypothetical protein [Breoghania sp.]
MDEPTKGFIPPAPEEPSPSAPEKAAEEAPQDDILSGDGAEISILDAPADAGILNEGGGDILGGDDANIPGGEPGADILSTPTSDENETTEATPQYKTEPFNPEAWAEFGGWYRQDFTIRYRPTGHADRFLRTWLDYLGHAFATPQETLLAPIFNELSPDRAVGRCTRCHSIDDDNGARHLKWHGFSSDRVRGRFTVFSHEPHLSAVGDKGLPCLSCTGTRRQRRIHRNL